MIALSILLCILTLVAGYVLGAARAFREMKLKAYERIVPSIIKGACKRPLSDSEKDDFNEALAKLWMFGHREAALKMERALTIMHNPDDHGGRNTEALRKALTQALQHAIVEIRSDIQVLPFRSLEWHQVGHFYTRFSEAPAGESASESEERSHDQDT